MTVNNAVPFTLTARFWARVTIGLPTDCWEWAGSLRGDGYGQFYAHGKHRAVHRFAHYIATLEWPPVVRHKCDNRRCCNPHHLEGGTQTDNMRDVVDRGRHYYANRTHCPHGHEYTKENTYIRKNGSRECRTCRRERKNRNGEGQTPVGVPQMPLRTYPVHQGQSAPDTSLPGGGQ